MSAIAGIVQLDGGPIERTDFERMARTLEARSPEFLRRHRETSCGLLYAGYHFTPEDRFERQPLQLADGSFMLFCGRLDNRQELIESLGLNRLQAGEMADSAIAAEAWLRWSTDGLERWIGPHATVIWKPDERRLILVRGAPSGRNLMFCRQGSTLFFSTSLDVLFALPRIPREFNEKALADILMSEPRGSEFLYQGLEGVPTSTWVEQRPEGSHKSCYWAPDPGRRLRFRSDAECWEAFSELFADVVRRYLRCPGEIGINLSGGLDSSTVAAQAAIILAGQGRKLHTYTRVPMAGVDPAELTRPGDLGYLDEAGKVNALAAMYPNMQVNLIDPGQTPVLDGLEDWFAANYTPWNVSPTYISGNRPQLDKARDDGIKLLLNAGAGNLTFSHLGFGRLRELFVRGRWLRLRRELKALARRGIATRTLVVREIINPMIPGFVHHWRLRQKVRSQEPWDWFSSIQPEFAQRSGALDRLVDDENLRLFLHRWSSWHRRARKFTARDPVAQGGGGELLYGFDQRDPTSDRRIVEFCLALPEKYYFENGVARRLVRQGLGHLLPAEIRNEFRLGIQDTDWRYRLKRDKARIVEQFEKLKNDPDVSRYVDVEKMEALMEEMDDFDWANSSRRKEAKFMIAMLGPLHAGSFIRWFYGRND